MFQDEDAKIDHKDMSIDYTEFTEKIFPVLVRISIFAIVSIFDNFFQVKRVPSFESAQIKSAYAGYEDFNTFDTSPIIGMLKFFFSINSHKPCMHFYISNFFKI